ncbi:MAG: OmcA/MtrC family decaheme c-type cytochrome [Myxococcales bacterium]
MRLRTAPCKRALILLPILGLAACQGPAGPAGAGCTAQTHADGSHTITCADGTRVTLTNGSAGATGQDGKPCTATTATDGAVVLTCPGSTPVLIAQGQDGQSCTATADAAAGTVTISCPGVDPVVVHDGAGAQPCTVTRDEAARTATIACPGVAPVVVADGAAGSDGTGCSVSDNGDGTKTITCGSTSVTVVDGAPGPSAADVVNLAADAVPFLSAEIDRITIAGRPEVSFTVRDSAGRGAVGLASGPSGQVRFVLAKLVPAAGTSGAWVNYLVSGNGVPGADRTGTLVDHRDGTYTYTFAADVTHVTTPTPIAWEPSLTTRLALQVSGSVNGHALPAFNRVHDFVPSGGPVGERRDIASTDACNECHGTLLAHGSRKEVGYCVTCHNPGVGDDGEMARMTHALHAAAKRAQDGAAGFSLGGHAYDGVTYPQDLGNCRKCHDGAAAATPQGENWKRFPSARACGACHASPTAAAHLAAKAGTICSTCHSESLVAEVHASGFDSPSSAGSLPGAYQLAYEIREVAVDSGGHPVVTFRVLEHGAPLDLKSLPADLGGGPSLLVAYSLPQENLLSCADYNNLGRFYGQPWSVSVANLAGGGGLSAKDSEGFHVATLQSIQFPAGAEMRTVALQGSFAQLNFPTVGAVLPRYATSVVGVVSGDLPRRSVVDDAKCARCHEPLIVHAGNRVGSTAVCALCHTPNLSSSGRGVDPATVEQRLLMTGSKDALEAAGYSATDPLSFPEVPMNLKELVHSIHGTAKRLAPLQFVRDRGSTGVSFRDYGHVTYPQGPSCLACHRPGTFSPEAIPAQALPTTVRTTANPDLAWTDVVAARQTVPNATDRVQSPRVGACGSCHDGDLALAHFRQNGGAAGVTRDTRQGVETCALCHGAGRVADVAAFHGP